MSKLNYFLLVEILLILIISFIRFKNLKMFFSQFYSFLFSGYYVFNKKLWDKHFSKSFDFGVYILIIIFFSIINILVFKYLILEKV